MNTNKKNMSEIGVTLAIVVSVSHTSPPLLLRSFASSLLLFGMMKAYERCCSRRGDG
jgi:hypothetical protein